MTASKANRDRITDTFTALKSRGECALIPYLTAGFPSRERTVGLLQALERGGADIIELGIPFSDPIADGPTIQRSSSDALDAGASLAWALDVVREFRKSSEVPIVLFGAYNPFFHYGIERFAADASAAGADAVLIPDVPADESEEVRPALEKAGMHLICLVAPTTSRERKKYIAACSTGFIYYISLKGVTGARASMNIEVQQPLAELREYSDLPVVVGFGISTPENAAAVARFADGVVVGSALIDLIAKNRSAADLEKQVQDFMASMKKPLRGKGQLAAAGSQN